MHRPVKKEISNNFPAKVGEESKIPKAPISKAPVKAPSDKVSSDKTSSDKAPVNTHLDKTPVKTFSGKAAPVKIPIVPIEPDLDEMEHLFTDEPDSKSTSDTTPRSIKKSNSKNNSRSKASTEKNNSRSKASSEKNNKSITNKLIQESLSRRTGLEKQQNLLQNDVNCVLEDASNEDDEEDDDSTGSADEREDFIKYDKNIRVAKAFMNNIGKNDWWGNLAYLSEDATIIIGGIHHVNKENKISGLYIGDNELRKFVDERKKYYKVLRSDFDNVIMMSPDLSQIATIDIRTIQIDNKESSIKTYTCPHLSLFIYDAKHKIKHYTDYWDYHQVTPHYSDCTSNLKVITKLENSADANNICSEKVKDHNNFKIATQILNNIINKDITSSENYFAKRIELSTFGFSSKKYYGFNGIAEYTKDLVLKCPTIKSSLFNLDVSKIIIPVLCDETSFVCEFTFDKSNCVSNMYFYFE